jgi:outer membrane protein OmpA-like peptidoglycan-associated protein
MTASLADDSGDEMGQSGPGSSDRMAGESGSRNGDGGTRAAGGAGSSARAAGGGSAGAGTDGSGADGSGAGNFSADGTSGSDGDTSAGASAGNGTGTGGNRSAGSTGGAGRSGDAIAGVNNQGAGGSGVGADDATVVGMVEAPGGRVRLDEEVTPQTLGGMLPMTVGVDEEGQFDFDKAVLRPEVKAVLDELITRLKDADWDRLDIVGYTDRIGTDAYNQHLSEQRAWAVARYMVDQGVSLQKLKVEGRGERNSQLVEGECRDLGREELIACLQKDRRVEIEASIRRSHPRLQ